MRHTRQRTDLLDLLAEVREFLTARDIHALLQQRGSRMSLATVYRNLGLLANQSLVDAVAGPTGELRYRACSDEHHHHLTCARCGRSVEIMLPDLETICAEVARRNGFSDVEHTVEIVGTCNECTGN